MITRQSITSAIAELSAVEVVSYTGYISNPRQVAIERKYSTYAVVSSETTATGRHKSIIFHEDDTLSPDTIRERVAKLVDSAIRSHEEQSAKDAESAKRREDAKRAETERQEAWVAKLRIAKSGQAEIPLEGTEHAFRVFSAKQLLDAGTDSGAYSIRIPLPVDLTKRAEFLAKLDLFAATL